MATIDGLTRPAVARDVKPLSRSGAHTFYQGVLSNTGEEVFIKHNAVKELFKSQPMKLLNPLVRVAQDLLLPNLDRLQDMTEVVFSNFARLYFERQGRLYSGLAYREVYFEDDKGKPHLNVAAPLLRNLGTLEDVPASEVSNPADAVEQTLLRGLVMGDWNCTFRDQNVGVARADTTVSDGRPMQAGEILDMDYGDAGTPHISRLGVPYGNRKLLQAWPQYIAPALEHLSKLDAQAIRGMIEEASQGVTGWTQELTEHYAGVLTANLDKAKAKLAEDPQWLTKSGANPFRHGDMAALKQFIFRIPTAYDTYLPLATSGVTGQVSSEEAAAQAIFAQKHPSKTFAVDANRSLEARDQVSRLLRYGSVIPAIGGGFEALYGLREIRDAKAQGDPHELTDGKVDVVRGSSSLLAGLTHVPMYLAQFLPSIVHLSHPVMLALGWAGGIGSTINCVMDGGRDIYNGITQHRPSDIGWGAVKVLGGALEVVGSFTLNVPMMIAANAIFAGAAAIQNRHAVKRLFHKIFGGGAAEEAPTPQSFTSLLDEAHAFGYQQARYQPVDPFGDACLVKRLSHIPVDITWVVLERADDKIHEWAPRNHQAAEPSVPSFEIRHDLPMDVDSLAAQFVSDIQGSGIAPTLGEEHRWSPEAQTAHVGVLGSKLFLMLADGQTARYAVTGQEDALKGWAMAQKDFTVLPHDLLRESYRLNQGDLYKTFLTCENVLNPDWKNPERAKDPLQQKLAYIRNDSAPLGDKYGAWYHFMGAALYALMRPALVARSVAEIEAAGSYVMGGPDPQEDAMNRLGARFGSMLRKRVQENAWTVDPTADKDYMRAPNLQGGGINM